VTAAESEVTSDRVHLRVLEFCPGTETVLAVIPRERESMIYKRISIIITNELSGESSKAASR